MCCCVNGVSRNTIIKSSLAFAIYVARHLLKQDIINGIYTICKYHLQATQNESKTFAHRSHTSMTVAQFVCMCVCVKYFQAKETETATKKKQETKTVTVTE